MKSNISEQTNYLQSKCTIIHPKNYKMSPLRGVTLAGLAKKYPAKYGGVRKANSAEGGTYQLADIYRRGPNPVANMDRGVDILGESKSAVTPDAIRQRGEIFQFLKVNKTANERKGYRPNNSKFYSASKYLENLNLDQSYRSVKIEKSRALSNRVWCVSAFTHKLEIPLSDSFQSAR